MEEAGAGWRRLVGCGGDLSCTRSVPSSPAWARRPRVCLLCFLSAQHFITTLTPARTRGRQPRHEEDCTGKSGK